MIFFTISNKRPTVQLHSVIGDTATGRDPAVLFLFIGCQGQVTPMWLPEPIYERLPHAYILIGLLFIAGTLYIGLEAAMAEVYLSLGFVSLLSGFVVFLRRRTERARQVDPHDTGLDV